MNQLQIDQEILAATGHYTAGRLIPAAEGFLRVLDHQPKHFQALLSLGAIAHQQGRFDVAAQLTQQALRVDPQSHVAAFNHAVALRTMKKIDEATVAFQRALAINPNHVETLCSLGNCFRDLDRTDEALAAYQQAVRINPDLCAAQNCLGVALSEVGRFDESLAVLRRSVELDPQDAGAHWSLSVALLLQGDSKGWDEFEWRKKFARLKPARTYPQPTWTGDPLNGRTILIHTEQGFGDSIQFGRYLPLVVAAGGRVLLGCQPALKRLFESVPGIDKIYTVDEPEDFDLHCSTLSLPLVLGTRFHLIPQAPYFTPPDALVDKWEKILPPPPQGKMRVGLCWAGGESERRRAMKLSQLNPLAKVKDIPFFSLQKGPSDTQGSELNMIDFTDQFTDFAETAAMMKQLDLVITVDTAVAHLAGAIGTPVWLMLMSNPDWRWFLNRDDSPWYSSMRLFRQSRLNQWEDVVARVAAALAERQH